MTIDAILSQIEIGNYALPEFQRGYVWSREQVKKLINSLYRGYPVGMLLTWVTPVDREIMRNGQETAYGNVDLILDGQQRITSLYGLIKGKAPEFFEGNASSFTNLYFNLDDEIFEFYMSTKMKDDKSWISVTELMQKGSGSFVSAFAGDAEKSSYYLSKMDKLARLDRIKQADLHVERVVGKDKTIDVVVDIFNSVNSGGTKLSKGDLALAKICAEWSGARSEMRGIIAKYENAGFKFKMDWLLRCVTVYLTEKAYFSELSSVSVPDFKKGLKETDKLISLILNQIASRLGLDHDRVLGSRYSIPLMVGYIHKRGHKNMDSHEWDKLLYWYVHTYLWGRYSGSTESTLSQDLNVLAEGKGIDGLINQLMQTRGTLDLTADDFRGWGSGARFYPLLYMMTRVNHAKDWGTGLELSNALLGNMSSLDVHHVFPKKVLYEAGFSKQMVNALANYTFLTKDTNIEISAKKPKDYFPVYTEKTPGAMETHWIPMDEELREIEKYPEFLEKRRELLAESANSFLQDLLHGSIEETEIQDYANRALDQKSDQDSASEEEIVMELSLWMEEKGLNPGEMYFDLSDDAGTHLATIDIAWPEGIQVGLREPVALLLDEPNDVHQIVNDAGYRYFTSEDSFKEYVESFEST